MVRRPAWRRCATGTFSAADSTKQIAELPPEQVRGPVEAEITKTLADGTGRIACDRLNKAMRTTRYQHLVQLLRGWRAAPPLTEAAGQEETTAAVKYVEKASERRTSGCGRPTTTSNELHRARKAMKRARYAAELVEPADSQMKAIARQGRGATNPARRASRCRCRRQLPRHGQCCCRRSRADNGFTYGVLMANELHRAAEIRASLKK